jgi:hypothetical protein
MPFKKLLKLYKNNRPIGHTQNRWIDCTLEILENVTSDEAYRIARYFTLTLPSMEIEK